MTLKTNISKKMAMTIAQWQYWTARLVGDGIRPTWLTKSQLAGQQSVGAMASAGGLAIGATDRAPMAKRVVLNDCIGALGH